MSQTLAIDDPYLMSPWCTTPESQELVLDPKYGNIRMTTPIGRTSYLYHLNARPKPKPNEAQKSFSGSLLMNPAAIGDLARACAMVANARWPQEQHPNPTDPTQMVMMTGEQMLWLPLGMNYRLSNPLHNGSELMYAKDPVKNKAYKGVWYITANANEFDKNGASRKPLVLNAQGVPVAGDIINSGDYARFMITIYSFPVPGNQVPNRGVAVALDAIQFVHSGERLGGFDVLKAAQAKFGQVPQGAAGTPAAPGPGQWGPPGGVPAGFAQPPAQMQPPVQNQPVQPPQQGQQVPQSQPTFQPPGPGGGGPMMPWNPTPSA